MFVLLLEGMVVGGVSLCIVPYGGRTRFWNGQTLDSGENHTWKRARASYLLMWG